jgi:pimeloyl-ACP methyl ester carboxylesterase
MWITLIALAVLIVLLFLMPARTPRIAIPPASDGRDSIASLEKVMIGGAEQWILTRSNDTRNPVLLYVHGGPGTSQLAQNRKNTLSLENHFTVVNWDQRGAGKSYGAMKDRNSMHMDQVVDDAIELSELLAKRFGKKKIAIAGHSWGSAIGVLAVAKRPGLFNAYIGIGQVADVMESEKISYEWTLEQAGKAGDIASVKKLTDYGAPPYSGDWVTKFMTQRRILGKYGGEFYGSKIGAFGSVIRDLVFSTEYTVIDRINFFRGILGSVRLMMPELMAVDLRSQVPQLDVPVWFMLGRHDYEAPFKVAEEYFSALIAPSKTLCWFENSSHMPNTEERELFNEILIEKVLPVVKEAS